MLSTYKSIVYLAYRGLILCKESIIFVSASDRFIDHVNPFISYVNYAWFECCNTNLCLPTDVYVWSNLIGYDEGDGESEHFTEDDADSEIYTEYDENAGASEAYDEYWFWIVVHCYLLLFIFYK